MDKAIVLWLLIVCIFICLSFFKKPDVKRLSKKPVFWGCTLLYTDQKTSHKKENVQYHTLLKSDFYRIQGKPDYVYKKGALVFPVEIKSGLVKEAQFPHEGDWMQVLLYFLLLEDIYGIRPKQGYLLYKDGWFILYNTKRMRRKILKQLEDMRYMLETGEGDVEPSFIKCKHCICKNTVCEYNDN